MAVNLSPVGGVAAQFFDNAGNVLTGGKLFTYAAGTTTPQTTYTTSAGNVPWSNPIILDAAGRVSGSGEIWLSDGTQYKFILRDSNDVLIATYDNVIGINSNFVNFTNEQEIQIATAGQTVFNLTTTQYSPGTNSLSVFVDGVNQYGPGAQYAYLETDADTVTFVNGLHVGALVKFTTSQLNSSGAVDAQQVSYNPPFVGAVATNVEAKLAQYVNILDFGADLTGITDCTTALNNAITAAQTNGGVVFVPKGKYRINTGNITLANVSIVGCGVPEKGLPYDNDGSVFLLYSTTQTPFVLGRAVNLDGLSFFYPDQNDTTVSPIVYPPLFAGTYVSQFLMTNCTIVNAYEGFRFETVVVGDVRINKNRIYCIHRVFYFLTGAPEIINLSDNIFSFGVYEDVSNTAPFYLRDYTSQNGSFLVGDMSGGSWTSIDGLTTSGNLIFGYRYGIRIVSGSLNVSNIDNNKFDAVATAVQIEATAKATSLNFTNNLFYSYVFGLTTANFPTINLGGTGQTTSVFLVGNEFAYSQGSAIVLSGPDVLDEVLIVANQFKSWGQTTSTPTNYYAIVINDQAASNKAFGLITNNQFKNNSTLGVGIIVGFVNGLLIESNHFRDCYAPIDIQNGDSIRIYGNKSEGTIGTSSVTIVPTASSVIEMNNNSWDKAPQRWAFPLVKANLSASQTIGAGPTAITTGFGTQVYDENNNFDPTTGKFVAGTIGFYHFDVVVTAQIGLTTGDLWKIYLKNNVSNQESGVVRTIVAGSGSQSFSFSADFYMNVNDDVVCYVQRLGGSGSFVLENDASLTYLCARKVM